MQKFSVLRAAAVPFPLAHVDTDQIIPARYMTTISRHGLGRWLFAESRYDDAGAEIPDFALNRPAWRRAGVLIAHENFGCGSSREHAPWALADFGIRCLVAPSFGDIFRANCLKNGLLPIRLPRAICDRLMEVAWKAPGSEFMVDLQRQTIASPDGEEVAFTVDPRERQALLTGADDIARSLRHEGRIAAYETSLDGVM